MRALFSYNKKFIGTRTMRKTMKILYNKWRRDTKSSSVHFSSYMRSYQYKKNFLQFKLLILNVCLLFSFVSGALFIFYVIFYSVLALLFAICMKVLLASLKDEYPKWQLSESIIGTSPGKRFFFLRTGTHPLRNILVRVEGRERYFQSFDRRLSIGILLLFIFNLDNLE